MDAPPPPYSEAVGSSSSTSAQGSSTTQRVRNGIPPEHRRSMEDERRPLPNGWVRQFDSKTGHQFFVDTRANPPRSIWHHPYDDEPYLKTLSSEERERVQEMYPTPSHDDIIAESSDDDDDHHHQGRATAPGQLPARQQSNPNKLEKFGRRMKDKMTSTTHEQRQAERAKRAEQERKAYEQHLAFRRALQRSLETGQPQLIGKDKNGQDVYIEPPQGYGGYGGYSGRGQPINPYSQGPYANPNARFIRPSNPYQRPYGYGYGGGLGLPLAAGLGGGLLLGGMMGGFGGGGF